MRPKRPQTILKKAGLSAFLITSPVNVRYLTGVQADPAFVLITAKSITLYVSDLDRDSAKTAAFDWVNVAPYEQFESDLKRRRRCGFEAESVAVARLSRWKRKFKNTKFVQTSGVIEEFRLSKSPDELQKIKRSRRITRELMRRVPGALRAGITEKQLASKLLLWALELGAESLSFTPIVAFGTHTACPHHRPTTRKLKKGHLVQIDCGVIYQGYCSDQSQVFFTGKLSKQEKEVYQAVREAFLAAKNALKPGVSGSKLDKIARDVLSSYGLEEYFIHTLGHGVGLELHEDPRLTVKLPEVKLPKNAVVTIEPGVYIPGKFGMRIEEEVIVT